MIFDLDQTLIDSRIAEPLRQQRRWQEVYRLIPQMHVYEGIDSFIRELKSRAIKTSIVTTAPSVYASKVDVYFKWNTDVIVGYHDTAKKKPSPEPYQLALKRLNILSTEAISLGDRDIDIISSKAAGITAAACLWGTENINALIAANPEHRFNSINELFLYLQSEKLIS